MQGDKFMPSSIFHIFKGIREFRNKMEQDHLAAYSAMASYFLLMSFLPFLMLLLMLAQFLPFSGNDVLNILNQVFIIKENTMIQTVIEEVFQRAGGTLMGITVVTLLWSASKSTWGFILGLNSVYEVTETRNKILMRIVAVFYTLIFILILAFSLALLVFGSSIYRYILVHHSFFAPVAAFLHPLKSFFSLFVLTGFFLLLYLHLPARKATIRSQLPGAVFTSLGWTLFSYVFSIYMSKSTNYSNLYGGLGAVLLFFLWLYVLMYILFLGAEINYFLSPEGRTSVFYHYYDAPYRRR